MVEHRFVVPMVVGSIPIARPIIKMKPIKIGIDARMFSDRFTGIGRYNFELTKRLFEQKDIEWVIFLNEPEYSQFEFPKHVKKVLVKAGHYSLAEQTRFLKLLWKEKCDLVHFTHFNLPIFYFRPFVVTIHDTTISFYPGKKMNVWYRKLGYQLVIRNAVLRAKKIITVSKNTKTDVIKLFKVKPEKIKPIWIAPASEFGPVSEKEKTRVREKFGLSDKFLLYTGNWREHKNLPRLIKAFAWVQAQQPDLHLVITGKPDPYYPEVPENVKKLKLEESVHLVGLVDFADLKALMGAATLYVFPTLYEGFGLPPLEAMACETPVVASRIASVPEVCAEAVEYFNPNNVDDIAAVIATVLCSGSTQEYLIKQGLERVKMFSWDQCATDTLKVYRMAL